MTVLLLSPNLPSKPLRRLLPKRRSPSARFASRKLIVRPAERATNVLKNVPTMAPTSLKSLLKKRAAAKARVNAAKVAKAATAREERGADAANSIVTAALLVERVLLVKAVVPTTGVRRWMVLKVLPKWLLLMVRTKPPLLLLRKKRRKRIP